MTHRFCFRLLCIAALVATLPAAAQAHGTAARVHGQHGWPSRSTAAG